MLLNAALGGDSLETQERSVSSEKPFSLPSLAIAQGEIARYSRTGSALHLAHASRALRDALREHEDLRQKELMAKWHDYTCVK